jgi:hypothetical protein
MAADFAREKANNMGSKNDNRRVETIWRGACLGNRQGHWLNPIAYDTRVQLIHHGILGRPNFAKYRRERI